jgi:alkanesulfonate monooxygenase SsuD/methylene tetrahydromethanopterin reductase-like flavin-dependent oxidoreductase (luciferase family)
MKIYVFDTLDFYADKPPNVRLSEAVDLAKFTESIGFDGFIVSEHHFSNVAVLTSPLIFLTWLSTIVKYQLGVFVLALPYYDPRRLAEDLIMLDNLIGGRLISGFGAGFNTV